MQNVDSYLSFNHQSFSRLLKDLYEGPQGHHRIIRSFNDRPYSELLVCIEDYLLIAMQQLNLGNRRRAYRIYLTIHILLRNELGKQTKQKTSTRSKEVSTHILSWLWGARNKTSF